MIELVGLLIVVGIIAGIIWYIPIIPLPFKYAIMGLILIIVVVYAFSFFGHPLMGHVPR